MLQYYYFIIFRISMAVQLLTVLQVKVVLRVSPALSDSQDQPPVLRIDSSNKRVTVMEPVSRSQPHSMMALNRDGRNLLKTFSLDWAYPQESSQVRFFILIILPIPISELLRVKAKLPNVPNWAVPL